MLLKVRINENNRNELRLLNCQCVRMEIGRIVFSGDNKNFTLKKRVDINGDIEKEIENAFMNNRPLNLEINSEGEILVV